jgi:hypothetical protein
MKLTKRQFNLLDAIYSLEIKMNWAAITSRTLPKREVLRLENLKLVVNVGLVYLEDGDGFMKDPETLREGYKITQLGRDAIENYRAAYITIGERQMNETATTN